jgi:hypothetical protein
LARTYDSNDEWRADLDSSDGPRVVSALHAACPCAGEVAWGRYEEFMTTLHRFKSDPRPDVRKTALHLEEDALGQLAQTDERAAGFLRNRPGGNGRRRELRRASRRYGIDK